VIDLTRYGEAEYSRGLCTVPVLGKKGQVQLIVARGVECTEANGARRTLSGVRRGTSRISQGWVPVDMIIRRDNPQCKPVHFRRWPVNDTPLEKTGPAGLYSRKGLAGPVQ
jgi:hypothetical protein